MNTPTRISAAGAGAFLLTLAIVLLVSQAVS